jgi:hypothetical protein
MGDVVNLRRARKRREREQSQERAAENRVVFGLPKAERERIEAEREKSGRDLEAHRRERPDDEA